MAFQENEARIMGNLGATPTLRHTNSGGAVTNLSVATTRKYKTQDGEVKSETTWHRIVVFGKTAENCCKYLKKSNPVKIVGRISNREWENKEGVKQYSTEIVANRVDFPPKSYTSTPAEDAVPAESAPNLSEE